MVPKLAKFDKRRLQQVLLNLLSNSVKYSTEGTIRVTPWIVFSRGKKLLEITVQDQGIGMKDDEVRGLFKPFAQFSNKDQR